MNKYHRSNAAIFYLVGVVALGACSGEPGPVVVDDQSAESTGSLAESLTSNGVTPLFNACWVTPGFATEKGWVQDQVAKTWESNANVKLNWSSAPCAAGTLPINIVDDANLKPQYSGGQLYLNFTFMHWPQEQAQPSDAQRQTEIRGIATHEFGHVLSFQHEHLRSDELATMGIGCPNGGEPEVGEAQFISSYDPESVMNYCKPRRSWSYNSNESLSAGDKDGVARRFGFKANSFFGGNWCGSSENRLFKGDFNNDSKTDLLCRAAGQTWIDYGNGFSGTDWSATTSFCPSMNLYVGDFNGDHQDDLLCRGPTKLAVDFADASGHFGWSADVDLPTDWCNHPEAGNQIIVGDFDGNGRDDLLCKGTNDMWIEYNNVPAIEGDWHSSTTWCDASVNELLVGHFAGSSRDDLLCHRKSDGRIWIDAADVDGHFLGTDWDSGVANGFCAGNNLQLVVGDLDGNTRDDLVCNDTSTGAKRIDLNYFNGLYFSKSNVPARGVWSGDFGAWCGASTNRFYVGRVDEDGRSDFICHDTVSGNRWTMVTPQLDFVRVAYPASHIEARAATVVVPACVGHLGKNDGCDCGCGARDSDCAGDAAGHCAYVSCSGSRVSLVTTPAERSKVVGGSSTTVTLFGETSENMTCY